WYLYPKEHEEVYLRQYNVDGSEYDAKSFVPLVLYDHRWFFLTDSLGICHRTCGFGTSVPINTHAQLAELISNATGMNIDEDEVKTIGKRIVTLARAFNARRGMSRKDDIVPRIFFEQEPAPPRRKLDRQVYDKYLDTYYELSGWNRDGIPTAETLAELGLDDVRQDLKQRGILALPAPVSAT
ncbi:MAG: hypothetical protein HY529_06435, partial [Chloroflexi bacterium]|nr:hypothetical protein [Chloroflexota bacterium]